MSKAPGIVRRRRSCGRAHTRVSLVRSAVLLGKPGSAQQYRPDPRKNRTRPGEILGPSGKPRLAQEILSRLRKS
eukprot:3175621-Prymnesium_polylepis.1